MIGLAVTVCGVLAGACGTTDPGLTATRSDGGADVTVDTEPNDPPATDPDTTDPVGTDAPTTDPSSTDVPTTDAPPTSDPGMMDLPGTTIPLDGPFPYDPNKPPQEFDGLMVATVEDLIEWWTAEMPRVFSQEYVPLAGGVFPAYPEREDYPQPGCFESYEEIAGNGFYCGYADYIVWDDTNYALPYYEDHGSGAITGLMSHEWGHAIQQRTGVFDIVPELSTVITELQADCYSGAWFGHIARGESDRLSFTDADIRSGLLDTALSADPVGTTPDEDGAHGAGFDRVAAFQDGFQLGTEQCATYAATPPPVTEIGFTDDELASDDPGDLPYTDLIDIVPTDLNQFWQSTLPSFTALTLVPFTGEAPSCGAVDMAANTNPLALYCPDTSTVYLAETGATQALDQIGDFGPIYLLATAWGEAAQTAIDSTLSGEPRVLYNDCLVGVWAGSLPITEEDATTLERNLLISAGDLDEAVATAIALGDDNAGDDVRGDAFAKVDAFRVGVLQGAAGCDTEYGG